MARDTILHTYNISGDDDAPKFITLREMGIMEIKRLLEKDGSQLERSVQGLRDSLTEIDGATVDRFILAGEKIEEYFNIREFTVAAALWNDVHTAEEDTIENAKKSASTTAGTTK